MREWEGEGDGDEDWDVEGWGRGTVKGAKLHWRIMRDKAVWVSTAPLACLLQLPCQSWSVPDQDSSCEGKYRSEPEAWCTPTRHSAPVAG